MEQNKEIHEKIEDITLENYLTSEFIYDSIVDQLGLNEINKSHAIAILKKSTKRHIVRIVLSTINDEEKKDLKDFISAYNNMSHDNAVIAFANKTPKLEEQVHKSLSTFFKDFVKKYKRILES